MFKESRFRSIVKTLSYRISTTVFTMLIVYLFTGKISTSLYIGGIEFVLKISFYFVHERAWNRIRFGRKEIIPRVIWITGLPASGKSTLAVALTEKLQSKGFKVEHLDGDTIRNILPNTGYSKEERNRHIRRVGYLASQLEKNGIFVVASFISPYNETREFAKSLCKNFVEIYLSTPLAICEKRDPKGLYKKAREGAIKNFTGIDDPYEIPENPDITINTEKYSVKQAVSIISGAINF